MTVFVAAFIVVAMLLATGVARVGSAAAARSRANNAADAAALAGADRLALGGSPVEACGVVRQTAVDNGARLVSCRCGASAAGVLHTDVAVDVGGAGGRARAEADLAGSVSGIGASLVEGNRDR